MTSNSPVTGIVSFAGVLADGNKVSQSARISKHGQWPLYLPLDGGSGFLLSWITFSNAPGSDFAGDARWVKAANPNATPFPGGFFFDTQIIGSKYVAPAKGVRIMPWGTGEAVFRGGNLPNAFTNAIALGSDNKVANLRGNKLTLTFKTATGTFTGTVTEPTFGRLVKFGGVVIQKSQVATGFSWARVSPDGCASGRERQKIEEQRHESI